MLFFEPKLILMLSSRLLASLHLIICSLIHRRTLEGGFSCAECLILHVRALSRPSFRFLTRHMINESSRLGGGMISARVNAAACVCA